MKVNNNFRSQWTDLEIKDNIESALLERALDKIVFSSDTEVFEIFLNLKGKKEVITFYLHECQDPDLIRVYLRDVWVRAKELKIPCIITTEF